MNKYKLIALDMDGTLLMSDKNVHPDTVRDIEYAAQKGIVMVYSSGREIVELLPYVELLPSVRFGVCASGAEVYDFREKKYVFRSGIPRNIVREVLETVGETTGMAHFLTDGASIVRGDQMSRMQDYHMEVYSDFYRQVATPVTSMLQELENHESVAKMNIYFRSPSDREDSYEKVKHLPLSFARCEKTSLEMTSPGVTKALGLRKLAEYLGISIEETVGIGDSDNDRAVLDAVAFAVAMGNAEPDIKEMCDMVTDDNDHNGAGKAIRRLIAE